MEFQILSFIHTALTIAALLVASATLFIVIRRIAWIIKQDRRERKRPLE